MAGVRSFFVLAVLALLCAGVALGSTQIAAKPSTVRVLQAQAGVLAGTHLGPRAVAALAQAAGFSGDSLFDAVAVAGGESWLYTRAHNDNTALVSAIPNGTQVRNVETLELTTVLDNSIGRVQLSDGEIVTVPLTVSYITSRDVGLWEINIPAAQIGTSIEANLYIPANNASAAVALWSRRGFQPWAAFNSGAWLADTYRSWAALGMANLWMSQTQAQALTAGKTPKTRVPWVSIPNLRVLYPAIPLG